MLNTRVRSFLAVKVKVAVLSAEKGSTRTPNAVQTTTVPRYGTVVLSTNVHVSSSGTLEFNAAKTVTVDTKSSHAETTNVRVLQQPMVGRPNAAIMKIVQEMLQELPVFGINAPARLIGPGASNVVATPIADMSQSNVFKTNACARCGWTDLNAALIPIVINS